MSSSKFFPPLVVGTLKPSITFILLPLLPLAPSSIPLLPLAFLAPSHSQLTPSCSPCSLAPSSLPLVPLTPSHSQLTLSHSPHSLSLPACSPHSQLAPQSLAPTEVVGTPKHSITYPYPPLAIGSKGSKLGVRVEVRRVSWKQ